MNELRFFTLLLSFDTEHGEINDQTLCVLKKTNGDGTGLVEFIDDETGEPSGMMNDVPLDDLTLYGVFNEETGEFKNGL